MYRILMCPPTHYGVEYVINPHMEGNVHNVDVERAIRQWKNLRAVISGYADVQLCEGVEGLPDMVFTANAGLYLKDIDVFITSIFATKERSPESYYFTKYMRDYSPASVHIPDCRSFEGAGDCLEDEHGRLWLGRGSRTTSDVQTTLEAYREVISLELTNPYFYHLDTCFAPLLNGYYLAYMPAFSAETRSLLLDEIGADKIISPSWEDAMRFACNAVVLGDTVITNAGVSPVFVDALRNIGKDVVSVDLSEFVKAGGAAKCLTLNI